MARRILARAVVGMVFFAGLLFLVTSTAFADDCRSFSDCFSTTGAAIVVLLGVAAIVALVVFAPEIFPATGLMIAEEVTAEGVVADGAVEEAGKAATADTADTQAGKDF
ncbi:MAG: hypothetical protein J2P37_02740 [Ktedonobacteraceae bacterium]|nr:hypothetical protein [Ktedonobacteraceae bacterium]MBO0792598.1 hypothetical protein [Ktedonobacteraceae bacterium]